MNRIIQIIPCPPELNVTPCFWDGEDGVTRELVSIVAIVADEEGYTFVTPMVFNACECMYEVPDDHPWFVGYEEDGRKKDWTGQIAFKKRMREERSLKNLDSENQKE